MSEHVFLVGTLIVFGVVISYAIRMAILGFRYDRYLKENHLEKWKEITTFRDMGPGMVNSYRAFKFLFSKEDLGDNHLAIMKAQCINALIYTIASIIRAC